MQELTEEGLPFVILFHHPDDAETTEKFRKLVTKELIAEKSKFNPGDFYNCNILPAIQAKAAKKGCVMQKGPFFWYDTDFLYLKKILLV